MEVALPSSVGGYLKEPAVPDPPARVWRDWALFGAASLAAVLEAVLRTDQDWTGIAPGWRVASVVTFFVSLPSLLIRRVRPAPAMLWAFVPTIVLGCAIAVTEGVFGGMTATVVFLTVPYAVYRWGSGRDGAIGAALLLAIWLAGVLADATTTLGDLIGGLIVLSIPVEAGLIVRYRNSARQRAIEEAKSRERAEIARELHDTVAHHVSAIAVQAQAGRAVAAADPHRAVEVLVVIEEAASRTLGEMRTMVGSLRNGTETELAPRQGVADLTRLARELPGDLRVDVDVDGELGAVGPAVDAAIYRIAQESITNAVRHARGATRVEVRLVPAGESVTLIVTDDGVPAAGGGGHGYGLLGMAERAHLLGGHLTAGPGGDRGWRVTAELPRTAVAT